MSVVPAFHLITHPFTCKKKKKKKVLAWTINYIVTVASWISQGAGSEVRDKLAGSLLGNCLWISTRQKRKGSKIRQREEQEPQAISHGTQKLERPFGVFISGTRASKLS